MTVAILRNPIIHGVLIIQKIRKAFDTIQWVSTSRCDGLSNIPVNVILYFEMLQQWNDQHKSHGVKNEVSNTPPVSMLHIQATNEGCKYNLIL